MKFDWTFFILAIFLLGLPALIIIQPQQNLWLQALVVGITSIPSALMLHFSLVWGDERYDAHTRYQSENRSCKSLK